MQRYKDLKGQRFGKLTVIEIDHFQECKNSKRTHWKCICDCGNEVIVRSDCLTTGNTKSCGCYNVSCREKPTSINIFLVSVNKRVEFPFEPLPRIIAFISKITMGYN